MPSFEWIAKIPARSGAGLLPGAADMLLFLAAGCTFEEEVAEGPSDLVFENKGWVRSILAERETIIIAHEEIPGFMPAMTMQVGDPVAFRFLAGKNDFWADRIRKLDDREAAALPRLEVRRPGSLCTRVPRLESGTFATAKPGRIQTPWAPSWSAPIPGW